MCGACTSHHHLALEKVCKHARMHACMHSYNPSYLSFSSRFILSRCHPCNSLPRTVEITCLSARSTSSCTSVDCVRVGRCPAWPAHVYPPTQTGAACTRVRSHTTCQRMRTRADGFQREMERGSCCGLLSWTVTPTSLPFPHPVPRTHTHLCLPTRHRCWRDA